jgi:hypothetical protein
VQGLQPLSRIIDLWYEVSIVHLLTPSVRPLDLPDPKAFFFDLAAYPVMDIVKWEVLNAG